MARSKNNWIMTGVVVAALVAVGIKFKEQLLVYADKIGIGEYLR